MAERVSCSDFEESWARRADVSIPTLREFGFEAQSCYCGSADCEGWKMVCKIRVAHGQKMEIEGGHYK